MKHVFYIKKMSMGDSMDKDTYFLELISSSKYRQLAGGAVHVLGISFILLFSSNLISLGEFEIGLHILCALIVLSNSLSGLWTSICPNRVPLSCVGFRLTIKYNFSHLPKKKERREVRFHFHRIHD